MKKLILALVSILLVLSMFSCVDKDKENGDKGNNGGGPDNPFSNGGGVETEPVPIF